METLVFAKISSSSVAEDFSTAVTIPIAVNLTSEWLGAKGEFAQPCINWGYS